MSDNHYTQPYDNYNPPLPPEPPFIDDYSVVYDDLPTQSNTNPIDYRAIALKYHAMGFNVSSVEFATKKPAHPWKVWHTNRQTDKDAGGLPWKDYYHKREQRQVTIGGVGFFAGVGFYRNFDFDNCPGDGPMLEALNLLGLPSNYEWVAQTGSGKGWHIIVKCYDDIATGLLELKDDETGVFTAKSRTGDFDHLELRWKECHNVLPPSQHNSGNTYRFRNGTMPTVEPTVVTVDKVVTAFRTLTVEPPAVVVEQKTPTFNGNYADLDRLTEEVRARFDLLNFATKELNAQSKTDGSEDRVLGQGGLMIKGQIWNWFGDGTGRTGGGALELINWLRFNDATTPSGKRFIEVLTIGAESLGLSLPPMPPREKPQIEVVKSTPKAAAMCNVTSIKDLLKKDFAPIKWVVPGLLTEGLTILAGPPKMGKSWLCLDFAVAVSCGGYALGKVKTEMGAVLYLALEDNERRLQTRAAGVLGAGDYETPDDLDVATTWARLNEGGADFIEQWLIAHPTARLIVVDTLKQIRTPQRGNANAYEQDYDAVQPLKKLADKYHVAIVIVHHTRKMEADDPLEMISGTFGLSGGVDGAMILKRKRGEADAVLYATGRDMDEKELAIKWDGSNTLWTLMGDAEQYAISKERQEIIAYLRDEPGATPKEIAEGLGKTDKAGAIRKLLGDMVKDGQIKNIERGKYYAKDSNKGNSSNNGNNGNNGNYDEWVFPESMNLLPNTA